MAYNQDAVWYALRVTEELNIPEEQAAIAIARLEGREEEVRSVLSQRGNGTGYRRDGTAIEDILQEVCTKKASTALVRYDGISSVYPINDDFLAVDNLQCVDADGNVFEQYDRLYVRKDIERDESEKQVNFTPYRAIVHMEKGKLFLPSFALTCNLVAALYQNKAHPEVKPVLLQYKNKGNGTGWHAQNTVIDWAEEKILHYPHKNDFLTNGGKAHINQEKERVMLPFAQKQERKFWFNRSLSNTTLENGLQDPLMNRFVRQLTGLSDPRILVEIGSYFGKPAKVWVSSSNETRAAWLGCDGDNFSLGGSDDLGNGSAARGVRRGAP